MGSCKLIEKAKREMADRSPVGDKSRARSGRGTDQDLPLKIEMRRLLWRMGCSVRLDVRMRAYIPRERGAAAAQDLTDLDVLGIGFTPGGQLHTTFADCRSSARGVMERMFWVKGVSSFVDASDAYMVRSRPVPAGARTLADRLKVGVITSEDFRAIEASFPTKLDLNGPLACLFDADAVSVHLEAHSNSHPGLGKLLNYLEFDYWILEPHRNLTQMVAHLQSATKVLDAANPRHRTLLYDCAWHYTLSIARAVAFVRATLASDVPSAVRTYVGGGEQALREKASLVRMLAEAGLPVAASVILPPYFEALIELVNRFFENPTLVAEVLRYTEFLSVSEVNRQSETLAVAFGSEVSPIAAKMVADTVAFLTTAAGLRPAFKDKCRERAVLDLTGGLPGAPEKSESSDTEAVVDEKNIRQEGLFDLGEG